jgi:hypothetical protein
MKLAKLEVDGVSVQLGTEWEGEPIKYEGFLKFVHSFNTMLRQT